MDADDGSERLLVHQRSVRRHPVEHGRVDVGLGSQPRRVASSDDQRRPARDGVVDVAAGTPLGVGGGHRAVRRLGVLRRARSGGAGGRRERLGERVGDPRGDDDPVDGDADLAHVRERAPRRRYRSLGDVGVVEHDERGVAAELEQ